LNLPSVASWVDQGYDFAPIIIKDLAYNASTFPATITPNGTDKIDGLANWTLAGDGSSVALSALSDKTGWFVA